MTDLSPTIESKSDQLNADDLLGGPRNVVVTKVTAGSAEHPIWVHYEGDNGKPWPPCKSMRRVLVAMWGPQGADYVGRSMTLFRDPSVKFGGVAVGGVRISRMSHIDSDTVLQLTESRDKKAPFKIRKLVVKEKPKRPSIDVVIQAFYSADGVDFIERTHAKAMTFEWETDELSKIEEAKKTALTKWKPGAEQAQERQREPGEEG